MVQLTTQVNMKAYAKITGNRMQITWSSNVKFRLQTTEPMEDKIKCTCPCHGQNDPTMHFVPCCDKDGYVFKTKKRVKPMEDKTKQQIQEALNLLSKERVNTAGLGAPINILKRLMEDSGPEPSTESVPSAEAELTDNKKRGILHNNLSECYNIYGITISEKYTPHLLIAMEQFANLCVEQKQKEWEKERAIMLRSNAAWDTISILDKLSDATDVLLHEKDYDRHGWEEVEYAWRASKELIASLKNLNHGKK